MKCKLCHDTGWQERGRALFLCDCEYGQYQKSKGSKSYNEPLEEVCELLFDAEYSLNKAQCNSEYVPMEHKFKFCPYCGRKIVVQE